MRFAQDARFLALALSWLPACGNCDDEPFEADASVVLDGQVDPGRPVEVDVSSVFAPGDSVRDAYGGRVALVDETGLLKINAHPNGVLLLEKEQAPGPERQFSWDNATVYFVMTDRFENGDPSNDGSYGRERDSEQEIGTFHGGDLAGLTNRLDYLVDLGATAVWITSPVEQVAGWVGGGPGTFRHYPYHGYWAKDFTKLDANVGTLDELKTFVDTAHEKGLRVVFDVVTNHPGYATMQDIAEYLPTVIDPAWRDWRPGPGETWHSYNDLLIDYDHPDWGNWWGPRWIRANLGGGYDRPGQDDLRRSLASLPDFRTEDFREVTLPPFYASKSDTNAIEVPGFRARDYLVKWHTDWVRTYGIDGFRCDTAKHVELASWKQLKDEGLAALDEWRQNNPTKALDQTPFWMTGEVFPHGVMKDNYFTEGGFDSLINFDFQNAAQNLIEDDEALDALYEAYSGSINADPAFNVLSYISSHDTSLFFDRTGGDLAAQLRIGTALLLSPGGVQIFYGDESGRRAGPDGSDKQQGTRSDMNWDENPELVAHWKRVGRFRKNHVAVGAGQHRRIARTNGYAFAREFDSNGIDDVVMIILLGASEMTE